MMYWVTIKQGLLKMPSKLIEFSWQIVHKIILPIMKKNICRHRHTHTHVHSILLCTMYSAIKTSPPYNKRLFVVKRVASQVLNDVEESSDWPHCSVWIWHFPCAQSGILRRRWMLLGFSWMRTCHFSLLLFPHPSAANSAYSIFSHK